LKQDKWGESKGGRLSGAKRSGMRDVWVICAMQALLAHLLLQPGGWCVTWQGENAKGGTECRCRRLGRRCGVRVTCNASLALNASRKHCPAAAHDALQGALPPAHMLLLQASRYHGGIVRQTCASFALPQCLRVGAVAKQSSACFFTCCLHGRGCTAACNATTAYSKHASNKTTGQSLCKVSPAVTMEEVVQQHAQCVLSEGGVACTPR
jgi:hypothetical protein